MCKKFCFICETLFQILNAITVTKNYDLNADLYINDLVPGTYDLIDRIKKEDVFENVYFINQREMWDKSIGPKSQYFWAFIGYFCLKKMIKKTLVNVDKYTDVFISTNEILGRFVICYFRKYTDVSVHYLDEGTGAYDNTCYEISSFDLFVRKVLYGRRTWDYEYDIYLNSTELFRLMNPESKVKTIPIGTLKKEYLGIIKRIFVIGNDDIITDSCIVFDTVHNEGKMVGNTDQYTEMVRLFVEHNNDVIVKPHPRDTKEYFDCDYYKGIKIPFECICYFMDSNNKKFLTFNSSAVFMPKLIFDQEPMVIFCYKALNNQVDRGMDTFELMVNNLKSLYRDENKVMIPESIGEYIDCINKL